MSAEELIKQLQAENAKLKDSLSNTENLNKSLMNEIVEQEKATAPAAVGATITSLLPEKPVTVDKKKYLITFPKFIFEGTEYTAHQAAKDPELLKKLVAISFGGLQEVA